MKIGWLFISVMLVLAFAIIAFLYIATSSFPYPKPARPAVVDDLINGNAELQNEHISYFLSELGAYKLHNPPGSTDMPRIEVILGERVYGAEVVAGQVGITNGALSNPDIRIISSKEEIIAAIRSGNIRGYTERSVAEGRMQVENIGPYSSLLYKGYLNFYDEMSGKSMTGNIVKMISE